MMMRDAVEKDILKLKKDQLPEAELRTEILNHPPANVNQLSTKYLVGMLGLQGVTELGSSTHRDQQVKSTIAKADSSQQRAFTDLARWRDHRSSKFDTVSTTGLQYATLT